MRTLRSFPLRGVLLLLVLALFTLTPAFAQPTGNVYTGTGVPSLTCPSGTTMYTIVGSPVTLLAPGYGTTSHAASINLPQASAGGNLTLWSKVGHPEDGCPGGARCNQGQVNESFNVLVDNSFFQFVPDHGESQWAEFRYPLSLTAGTHNFTFNHSGFTESPNSVDLIAAYCATTPPPPPPTGNQGCTPGYWKNHPGSWAGTGYSTGQAVNTVFGVGGGLGSQSLLSALDGGGGPGVEGATRILVRAAVAAVLNAANSGVQYPLSAADIIAQVNAAVASNNRQTILDLAGRLDRNNNLGCPLR